MANYINTVTNQYPVSETQIRQLYPNVSFPRPFVAPAEYSMVFPAPPAAYDSMAQFAVEVAPLLTDKGHYEQQWEIRDLDADTIAANQAKAKQDFIAMTVTNTQARLDNFAKTRNYDGILSAASYAVSSHPPFANEGRYCADARDATWGALYSLMAAVEAGTEAMPTTYEEVEAYLPELTWPT